MSSNQDTPPGWYPDPSGDGGRRWWDGNAWTDHREEAGAAADATAAMPTTPDAGGTPAGNDATIQMPAASGGDQAWGGAAVPPPPGAPGGGAPIPPPPGAAGGGFSGQPPYVPGGPVGGGPGGPDGAKKSKTGLIVGIVAGVLVLALVIAGVVLLGNRDEEVVAGPDSTPATTAESTTTTEKAGTSSTRRTTTTRGTTTTTKPTGPADGVPASGSGWEMMTSPTWTKGPSSGVDSLWYVGASAADSMGDSVAVNTIPQGGVSPKEMVDIMAANMPSAGGGLTVTSSKVENKNGREYGVIETTMSQEGVALNQRIYFFVGKKKSLMVIAQGLPSRYPAVVQQAEPYILTATISD